MEEQALAKGTKVRRDRWRAERAQPGGLNPAEELGYYPGGSGAP